MTPENARRVANGIIVLAGVALAGLIVRQPGLRRAARRAAPLLLRQIRPVHVAAVVGALAGTAPAGVAAAAGAAARGRTEAASSRPAPSGLS